MNYLLWHYSLAPKFILFLIGNYLFFVGHLFSLKLLLRTLFSPWRREIAKKEKPGLNLEDIADVVSFNIISRIMGFVIRLSTLFTALFFFVLVIFLGFILFFLWFPDVLVLRRRQKGLLSGVWRSAAGIGRKSCGCIVRVKDQPPDGNN
jgi:hypothetical protein